MFGLYSYSLLSQFQHNKTIKLTFSLQRQTEWHYRILPWSQLCHEMIDYYDGSDEQGSRLFSNVGGAKFFSQRQRTNYIWGGAELFTLEVI